MNGDSYLTYKEIAKINERKEAFAAMKKRRNKAAY